MAEMPELVQLHKELKDDPDFARILMDMAHERGFKAVVATFGRSVISLARKYQGVAQEYLGMTEHLF